MSVSESVDTPSAADLRTALLFTAGTLLLVGTLLLRVPQGLGALASTLPAYLQGWLPGAAIQAIPVLPAPALRLPLALLVYQPLVVLFAGIATLRAWFGTEREHTLGKYLSLWGLVALLVAMLYPSRQVADAVWALIPLWGLAALELARYLPGGKGWINTPSELPLGLAHTAMVALFAALFFYNLLRLERYNAQPWLYTAVLAGIAMMILVVSFLVAAGWSVEVSRLGLVWGFSLVLSTAMLSSMWHAAQVRPNTAGELWGIQPGPGQITILMQTLGELSEWRTGLRDQIDVLVTVDSPALRWALRSFPKVRYASGVTAVDLAAVIITPQDQQTLELVAAYRGQDFAWRDYPAWNGLLPVQWLDWLFFRQAPASHQQVILWARSDLFPGSEPQLNSLLSDQPFITYPDEDPLIPAAELDSAAELNSAQLPTNP